MFSGFSIDLTAIYDDSSLELALGLSEQTLAKARKAGKLRFTRQGRRILYLGDWILKWLEAEGTTGYTARAVGEEVTRAS